MKKLKSLLFKFPEYYLVLLVLLSGFKPPFYFAPLAIGLATLLVIQIYLKNNILGFSMAVLFLLGNIFLLFAVISEFNEFVALNARTIQLLVGGMMLFIINGLAAGIMIYKYGFAAKADKLHGSISS
jgi:hypothetical protein